MATKYTSTTQLPFGIKRGSKSPWDASDVVDNFSDILAFTLTDLIYVGKVVACLGLDDATKRGLWLCIDDSLPFTEAKFIHFVDKSQFEVTGSDYKGWRWSETYSCEYLKKHGNTNVDSIEQGDIVRNKMVLDQVNGLWSSYLFAKVVDANINNRDKVESYVKINTIV